MRRHHLLKQLDIDINESAGGIPDTTISFQSSVGVNKRHSHKLTQQEAMNITHANMIGGALGIVAGAFLYKKNPILGTVLMAGGAGAIGVTVADWHVGKREMIEKGLRQVHK